MSGSLDILNFTGAISELNWAYGKGEGVQASRRQPMHAIDALPNAREHGTRKDGCVTRNLTKPIGHTLTLYPGAAEQKCQSFK